MEDLSHFAFNNEVVVAMGRDMDSFMARAWKLLKVNRSAEKAPSAC